MHPGSRAICFLTALLAAAVELLSAAFGPVDATAAALPAVTVNEAGSNAAIVAEQAAAALRIATIAVVKQQNFSTSPLELRIVAHPPLLRVIANGETDSRQMASLADANQRQLLFVKITLG